MKELSGPLLQPPPSSPFGPVRPNLSTQCDLRASATSGPVRPNLSTQGATLFCQPPGPAMDAAADVRLLVADDVGFLKGEPWYNLTESQPAHRCSPLAKCSVNKGTLQLCLRFFCFSRPPLRDGSLLRGNVLSRMCPNVGAQP